MYVPGVADDAHVGQCVGLLCRQRTAVETLAATEQPLSVEGVVVDGTLVGVTIGVVVVGTV